MMEYDRVPNVFIFNFIENNANDIAFLCNVFAALKSNQINVYQRLDYANFRSEVDKICNIDMKRENFSLLKYIAVVVLDNSDSDYYLLKTSDDKPVNIENQLLTYIKKHKELANKNCLYILQNNQLYPKVPYEVCPLGGNVYADRTAYLYATDVGERLNDYWSNEDAELSPFIRSFGENFYQYARTHTIKEIYGKMNKDLRRSNLTPCMGGNAPNVIFGQCFSDDDMRIWLLDFEGVKIVEISNTTIMEHYMEYSKIT